MAASKNTAIYFQLISLHSIFYINLRETRHSKVCYKSDEYSPQKILNGEVFGAAPPTGLKDDSETQKTFIIQRFLLKDIMDSDVWASILKNNNKNGLDSEH